MHTPDTPEAIEAGLASFMTTLENLMKGKSPEEKKVILARLFGEVYISLEHTPFGYWTVSTRLGSGIFSLERDTFLELPEGKGVKKYFSNITSKGIIPLSDGTHILTICFGGHRVTQRDLIRIERFCYIENGKMHLFNDLPNPCSLQMASTLFQTKRNEAIARANQSGDNDRDGVV